VGVLSEFFQPVKPCSQNGRLWIAIGEQACDLGFAQRYGAVSEGFIEAHRLKPIATLEEGVPVTYDVAADFAVLCANCHRMICRGADPSDLVTLRALVQSKKI